ncbi:MAG: phage virion morphogenesis protein [Campylobacterales bacterium]|nr:phage virion morphogenesis protein [Campylobacterales bacterium]
MSIKVTGLEEIRTTLSKLHDATHNMHPMMAEIGNMLINEIDETFEDEGRPKWTPLSRTTLRLGYTNMGKSKKKKTHPNNGKVSKGFERKILQKSGRLRGSITKEITNNSATVGTNLEYAAIHQFGGMAGRGRKVKIPARPYMPINKAGNLKPSLRQDILEYVQKTMEEAVK